MMATYFNGGSEIQADNLQTLYLMNRGGYAGAYSSDASQPPPGVLFLNNGPGGNSASALAHQGSIHHHHQHHLVGIPLAGASSSGDDPGRPSLHEISAVGSSAVALHGQLVPRFHYNLWGGGGDPSPSGGHQIPTAIAMSGGGSELGSSPMGFRRPAPVTIAATSSTSSLDHHHHHHNHQQGGLSLSLNNSSPHKNAAARPMALAVLSPGSGTPTSASGVSHAGAPSMIAGSKFLKAAQQLLDEVVNVGKAIDSKTDGISTKDKAKAAVVVGTGDGSSGGGESGGAKGAAAELTTAQRQELQMKKAKLLNMLDEVEQRYRQYHSQMQMVAASFEQAAGERSAKSYTALALQTISKQFRCLKDAIASQIKATGKSMGEEEEDDDEGGEGKTRSRLRMVDHQLRQQRALQQLGMMHHNAWRPQRGLPERAVSVLRAWLFEHFLHPYPKDSDKHMLAKQTGLTRSQVSNWFINARVRLWKPMVEEMYVEEMKSQEQNGSDNNHTIATTTNANDHNNDAASPKSLHSRHGHNHSFNQNPQELLAPNDVVSNPAMTTMISTSSSNGPLQGFSLSEMDPMMGHRSPKRQRMMINSDVVPTTTILTSMDKLEMKPGGRDLFPPDLTGFGSYPMGEIGSRFNPDQHQYHQGNTVSLTLGLPHDCDQSLSLSATHQQSYFPGHGGQAVQMPSAGGGYEEMNDVQSRKRFAAQLLPDYVT